MSATVVHTARLVFDRMFRYHGLPTKIICDCDPRFISNFWRHLFRLTGTQLAPSTANHPQTDGQSERANRTIRQMLRAYIQGCENNWDMLLTPVEFAYNNSTQTSTQETSFLFNSGRPVGTPSDHDK